MERAEIADTYDTISALEDGSFSDLKVVSSDGKVFNVHKVVLCTQSPYFRAACTIDMKVGHERFCFFAQEQVLDMPDNVMVLRQMLGIPKLVSRHRGLNPVMLEEVDFKADTTPGES